MDVMDAAEAIAAEVETLAERETALLDELARTRANRERLVRAVDAVLATLPPERRRPVQLRMNRVAMKLAGELRADPNRTDKVEAVHDYLARADGVVTVKAVQRYLQRHGLAAYDDAAALLLARKCRQGLIKRVGRGRYSVNQHHPAIASRRMDSAIVRPR